MTINQTQPAPLNSGQSQLMEEIPSKTANGWAIAPLHLLVAIAGPLAIYYSGIGRGDLSIPLLSSGIVFILGALLMFGGYFILEPNEANVLTFVGNYVGTAKDTGLRFTNPLYSGAGFSLRDANHVVDPIKVNDKLGNPIEIGAAIIWRVANTAQAHFEVDAYRHFVQVQSESALRDLAGNYAYDDMREDEDEGEPAITLRGSREEVAEDLKKQLSARLRRAGVLVLEARITHLAYAREIAEAMLRRQQADALLAARKKLVKGSVAMTKDAIEQLAEDDDIKFEPADKTKLASSLLVVLCGEQQAQPVLDV